ncbi:MAG: GNAT family N-acetyltransferase [Rhodospirillales bacterium]|nr:MAG: GNAT family N-acetyltransferase [Rhodospirillales bacterium]
MSLRRLETMLRPRSVALIGASARPGSVGELLLRRLTSGAFKGAVWPVNPKGRVDAARPAFRAPKDLPEIPDLALIAAPAAAVPGAVRDLAKRGCRAAVVFAADLGGGDQRRHGKAVELATRYARRAGMSLLGPASAGLQSPAIGLDASLLATAAPDGDLAFVTQSAAVASAALDWAATRRIGFSHVVTLGEAVDVDFGLMLDWLALDERTRAILVHIESVRDSRRFLSAARAAARSKPVIALKTGRTPASARAVHAPGGAVGADEVYEAAFRRAGMLRVGDLDELFEATTTLAAKRHPSGDRLAILANGGGLGVLAADALHELGGRLVAAAGGGPNDIGSDAPPERYTAATSAALDDPMVDALLVTQAPSAFVDSRAAADAVIAAAAASGTRKPVLASWVGGETQRGAREAFTAAGLPVYDTPRQAVRGFMHLVQFRRNREILMETPASQPEAFAIDIAAARAVIDAARRAGRIELSSVESLALLRAASITTAPTFRPVEVDAYDLVVALRDDPVFGPVVVFGRGGLVGRRLDDRALALPPLNMHLAREAMARTRVWRLLQGDSERAPVALDALALTLIKVAQIAVELPDVATLRIDPLRVDGAGVIAMEARVWLTPAPRAAPRLAIRPYPKELERRETLRDGTSFALRPLRPEDEPEVIRMIGRMDREDVRLRFFAPMARLSHDMAARLTQLDYDRQMALVAIGVEPDGASHGWGVVRLAADPDNESAEFAVTVRTDLKGRGLGTLLMERIIAYARASGLKTLTGMVLAENEPMLTLCRRLGFRAARDREDPGVVRVELPL